MSDGHTLVVTRRVVASWFDATPAERASLLDLVDELGRRLDETHRPDGYNVGAAAGQPSTSPERCAPAPQPARRRRGTTHLAMAIACRATQHGFDVRFVTAAELVDDLSAAFRAGRLADALSGYVTPAVLVVDEVGDLT